MSKKSKSRLVRPRRIHSEEFKREAVNLVTEQGSSVAEAARNLGIGANLLHRWKAKFAAEADGEGLSDDERMELARLRSENTRLRMERDILKKVAPGKFGKGGCVMSS
jgi:transposase